MTGVNCKAPSRLPNKTPTRCILMPTLRWPDLYQNCSPGIAFCAEFVSRGIQDANIFTSNPYLEIDSSQVEIFKSCQCKSKQRANGNDVERKVVALLESKSIVHSTIIPQERPTLFRMRILRALDGYRSRSLHIQRKVRACTQGAS